MREQSVDLPRLRLSKSLTRIVEALQGQQAVGQVTVRATRIGSDPKAFAVGIATSGIVSERAVDKTEVEMSAVLARVAGNPLLISIGRLFQFSCRG